jgi:hypothetical protein
MSVKCARKMRSEIENCIVHGLEFSILLENRILSGIS